MSWKQEKGGDESGESRDGRVRVGGEEREERERVRERAEKEKADGIRVRWGCGWSECGKWG